MIATEPESAKTGSGLVASCQKPGPMIPAHQLASRPAVSPNPDKAIQIGSGSVLYNIHIYDPCLLWKNETEPDAGSWIRHIYDLVQFWL